MSQNTTRALGRVPVASLVLSLAGLAVSTYLTVAHFRQGALLCAEGEVVDCGTVTTSEQSELLGIPVAVLGVVGYVLIFASVWVPGDAGRLAGAVLSLAGFGFSAYLTYREIFTIDAICQWCVVSAVLMTVLAVLAVWRLLAAD